MPQILYFGQTVELSEHELLLWLEMLAEGHYNAAYDLYGCTLGGLPDTIDIFISFIEKSLEHLQGTLPAVDDAQLRELLRSLDLHVRSLIEQNFLLIDTIAKFVNLPAPKSKSDRRKLNRHLDRYSSTGRIWIREPEYQRTAKQSEEEFAMAGKVKEQLDNRLAHLLRVEEGEATSTEFRGLQEIAEIGYGAMSADMKRLVRPHGWEPPADTDSNDYENSD